MRFNRMVDQRQRLRDLMSEVQENHTDIQRLWKSIEAGGIVWPVGIAAAPPIEENAESSSWDCDNCSIPSSLTLTVTRTSAPSGSSIDTFIGDNALTFGTQYGSPAAWWGDCNADYSVDDSAKIRVTCYSGDSLKVAVITFPDSKDCTNLDVPGLITLSDLAITSCDPFHAEGTGTSGGSSYSFDLTE